MPYTVRVVTRGPVFDGRAVDALHEFTTAAIDYVADRGLEQVQQNLSTSIRHVKVSRAPGHPGYYQAHVHINSRGASRVITDDAVIYGYWLEGIGSRNKTTRFKGYFSFRRAAQSLKSHAKELSEQALPPFLARMNGV